MIPLFILFDLVTLIVHKADDNDDDDADDDDDDVNYRISNDERS